MDYQPSYGFLKDCLYRSESYKVTLADAYLPTTNRHDWARSLPFPGSVKPAGPQMSTWALSNR